MNQEQFAYSNQQQIKLNKLIGGLLAYSKKSTPYFPPLWSKHITEQNGLECNEDTFFNLISNVVDFKLDQCAKKIKQHTINNQNLNINTTGHKKQNKDLILRTLAVQNYFNHFGGSVSLARPRVYPEFQVNSNQNEILIPRGNQQQQDMQ